MLDEELKTIKITRYAELVERYIANNYVKPSVSRYSLWSEDSTPRYSIQSEDSAPHYSSRPSLDDALQEVRKGGDTTRALKSLSQAKENTFSEKLLEHIDGMDADNAEVYKAAGIDRRLFSKIQTDADYKPSKDTCVALAFALKLNDEQAKDLLKRAGYALSRSSKRDLILEYFFRIGVFDLDIINGVLEKLGEKTLGKIHYD